jgi:FkbM family methyltransferase
MHKQLKEKLLEHFRIILRPFYLPIANGLRSKLVTSHAFIRHPHMALPTPWDFVQFQVERHLHEYLHCGRAEIKKMVIVGANIGDEIVVLSHNYPRATFVCYEPSPRYFSVLQQRFGSNPKVSCRMAACGESVGSATFHELPMDGNGSILPPDPAAWQTFNNWHEIPETEKFKVEVHTLDQDLPDTPVDLLWADVQGFEKQVLLGAQSMLSRTKSVFLEVSNGRTPYEGGAMFDTLDGFLTSCGLKLVGLGLDPWNFSGNALWIRDPERLSCQTFPRE